MLSLEFLSSILFKLVSIEAIIIIIVITTII